MRLRAQQSWPALPKTAPSDFATQTSRSASAKTTFADLPPSSSETRLISGAAPRRIDAPFSESPVNEIFRIAGSSTSAAPTFAPGPAITLRTPSGIPASVASAPSRSAVHGVALAGFSTAVFPAASAGATFQAAIRNGKFHGTINAQGPTGWRSTNDRPVPSTGGTRPESVVAAPAKNSKHCAAASTSHSRVADRLAGVARLERREFRAPCSRMRAASARSACARSTARARGHGPLRNARSAACTARCASPTVAHATAASVAPVAGSATSIVAPPSAARARPSIHSWNCSFPTTPPARAPQGSDESAAGWGESGAAAPA